jgi:F0F1-type ATP synthase assembly protein I
VESKKARKQRFFESAARYTSIAMTLPGMILAGYLIGYALDRWFQTSYLKIVFLLLGIAAGFYELFQTLARDMNRDKK